ncbi:restriction endonuclease-related protein [Herbaspirillum seropedicae]|uniref:restriction endonuclease-related protein n=1 Tax=Herbaspirillum seropedicae TaxID=964 RepID=UPI003F8D5EC4
MDSLEDALKDQLSQAEAPLSSIFQNEEAVSAARMLATGVCSQYRLARSGIPTVHDVTMSGPLAQALMLLASLYISAGKEDHGGSVHEILQRCRQPLGRNDWNLPAFADPTFPYHGITLLDPDRRIPTLDCVEMARQTQSELDLREQLAFESLRSTSEQFIGRQEQAYTDLRLWVTETPITSVQDMQNFERSKNLQLAASFLSSCYEAVQPHHLVDGKLYVCESCGTPMRRASGDKHLLACRTPQCKSYDRPLETLPRQFGDNTLIAKPAILTYWIGPGLDELTLYRAATANEYEVRLYPAKDACDLSLDGRNIGIDVKSYASPFILADRLNRSAQGLAIYSRRIVAINDQAISRFSGYLEVLRRQYTGDLTLEFISVRELLKTLERPF